VPIKTISKLCQFQHLQNSFVVQVMVQAYVRIIFVSTIFVGHWGVGVCEELIPCYKG
jgi:hypothetical protein